MERRRLRVYVAGPMSKGDVFDNITRGVRCGSMMVRDGLAPYVPHLDRYMTLGDDSALGSWNALLEWDMEWVAQAEALYRLSGDSSGAARETEMALELGIPVFYQLDPLATGAEDPGYRALLRYAMERDLVGVRR